MIQVVHSSSSHERLIGWAVKVSSRTHTIRCWGSVAQYLYSRIGELNVSSLSVVGRKQPSGA